MTQITTPDEWWTMLEENWEDLLMIGARYAPIHQVATVDQSPDGIPFPDGRTVLEDIMRAKARRSDWGRLRDYLQMIWASAPDQADIHDNPGWSVLCDLLSEDWVFQEE